MGPRVEELESDQPLLPDPDPTAQPTAGPNADYDENEAFIPPDLLCTIEQLQQRISVLFPESADAVKSQAAIALIGRAYRRSAYQYNMLAAIEAVGEFHFPAEDLARDLHEFIEAGEDFEVMIERRIAARHQSRLNPARIQQCISADNPQRETLLEFATTGVDVRKILPMDQFQHNGDDPAHWPKQTADYKQGSNVINSLLSKTFHAKGLAIILPASRLRELQGSNVSTSGWAPKSGEKSKGRPTFYPKALNLEATKLNADEAWGVVRHPKASCMVSMILRYGREMIPKGYTWAQFRLWTSTAHMPRRTTPPAPASC
jgi:hypothetical protein